MRPGGTGLSEPPRGALYLKGVLASGASATRFFGTNHNSLSLAPFAVTLLTYGQVPAAHSGQWHPTWILVHSVECHPMPVLPVTIPA
jgi:hypothetical protein